MPHDHDHDHDHGHGHDRGHHGHHHAPPTATPGSAFAVGVGLNVAFLVVEAVYGLLSHSMALLADAAHNLGDVLGLVLAWIAAVLARRPPSPRRTYGLRRSTILAALTNAVLLLVAVVVVCHEAVLRLRAPMPVPGVTVVVVAAAGVLVNGASAMMFRGSQRSDANARGAYLHLASDALVSLAVVVAGVIMWRTRWWWLDPAMSLAVSLVIVVGAWSLLREALDLSLDAVPRRIELDAIESYLRRVPDVRGVHDLHVWSLSTTDVAMTAHLVVPAGVDFGGAQRDIVGAMRERFGIGHTTLQVEHLTPEGAPDPDCLHDGGCRAST